MPVVAFRGGYGIPLWPVALCAVALSAPQRVMPLVITLLGVSVLASAMPAIVRAFRPSRRRVEVLPALDDALPPAASIITESTRSGALDTAIDDRTKTDDTADLVRMDDDGARHMDRSPAAADGPVPRVGSEAAMNSATAMIPGAREAGMLTTFGTHAAGMPTNQVGPSTMDAVTIAEHQREGGGAPSQRRPVRAGVPWTGPGGRLHEFLAPARLLFVWRFRTTH